MTRSLFSSVRKSKTIIFALAFNPFDTKFIDLRPVPASSSILRSAIASRSLETATRAEKFYRGLPPLKNDVRRVDECVNDSATILSPDP